MVRFKHFFLLKPNPTDVVRISCMNTDGSSIRIIVTCIQWQMEVLGVPLNRAFSHSLPKFDQRSRKYWEKDFLFLRMKRSESKIYFHKTKPKQNRLIPFSSEAHDSSHTLFHFRHCEQLKVVPRYASRSAHPVFALKSAYFWNGNIFRVSGSTLDLNS